MISSVDELAKFCERLLQGDGPIGFDIESGYTGPDREKFSLHPETALVAGISFTNSTLWARYAPLAHEQGENLDNHEAARLLWPVLSSGRGVAHNATFELRHLSRWFYRHLADDPEYGQAVRAERGYFKIRSDTQVEAYLAAEYQQFGLKPLVENIFGHKMTELHELFPGLTKKARKALRFNTLELTPQVVEYACEDALWCLALHERYYDRVRRDRELLYNVEMGVLDCVCEMEDFGVRYDWAEMRRGADASRAFRDKFNAEIMSELSEMIGTPVAVNLGSPPQISSLLFAKLGLTTTRYTAKTRDLPPDQRKMSTDKIALAGLAKQYPVVKKITQWKELKRLEGTYLDKYEGLYNYAPDGRTHPNHLSAVVVTGRFAVADPPYQQSPKTYHFDLEPARQAHAAHADAHGAKCSCGEFAPPPGTCFTFNFRDVITAPDDHYILGFDLSQAELRAIAGEAKEEALLRAFATGQDVHTLTSALMLKIPIEQVDKDLRSIGKAQPLDAKILTPAGWRRMGDLQVGDQVIGSDGHPTKITGVFPQGERDVFRVTTSDGASTECCGEHLWTVQNINTKSGKWVTKELRQLVASGLTRAAQKVKGRLYEQPKYRLPDRPVVQFEPGPELPIDPYVLGLLLGDGGFTHSWGPMFGSADRELLDAVRQEHESRGGRWASEEETSPGFSRAYLAAGKRFDRAGNSVKTALRELGLWGKRDHEKFVPEAYLKAAPEDRLALLQGLLDTDGNVQASGAQFRVTSRELAEAAQFLARSLGGWASLAEMPLATTPFHVKSEPRLKWMVYLRLPAGVCPFRVSRKRLKWKASKYRAPQTIASVESVGVKQTQCISVEARNGLYCTDGFTYTHNTMNFALLYGMGVKSLAERLAVSIEEAQSLYDKYFSVYSNIAAWSAKQVEHGKTHGYVTSRFGRRLPIWEYKSDKRWIYQKGDRACVNYPIQGSATGDFMKMAMVRARRALRDAGLADRVHMVMNIHDALEFSVHRTVLPQKVIEVLQPAVIFPVPGWPAMHADWHIGKRWGSLKEIEITSDGRFLVKGDRVQELAPVVEEDEDTGDEVIVLPEVDPDAVRRAVELVRDDADRFSPDTTDAARQAIEAGAIDDMQIGKHLIIELTDMPDEISYSRFRDLLASRPGPNTLTLRTPEGDLDIDLLRGTDLNSGDVAAVSLILGAVRIFYDAADVDAHQVVGDLVF